MGMIDAQYRDQVYRDTLKENERLKKEIVILDKLLELNMKDLWDIADQRDWYYEECQKLKAKLAN
jgi:hypothetical protein